MNTFTLLQFSETVAAKSADMAAKDPYGVIITFVSVMVVFIALVTLYFAYSFIGKISSGELKLPSAKKKGVGKAKGGPSGEEAAAIAMALDQEMNGETYAAISMAMHLYMNSTVHDMESYIITIKRKQK